MQIRTPQQCHQPPAPSQCCGIDVSKLTAGQIVQLRRALGIQSAPASVELTPAQLTQIQTNVISSIGNPAGYTHTQATPATVWTVNHNLGRQPSIVVTDFAGNEFFGGIVQGVNTSTLYFATAVTGYAYCT
jgi:hypothetical protein